MRRLIGHAVLATSVLLGFDASHQEVPNRPAEEVYRNIEVLRGTRASDVPMLMQEFSHALGVECSYCHVPDQWDLDEKPQFVTARGRWPAILASAPDGQNLTMTAYARSLGVSCEYCHTTNDWKNTEKAPMRAMPTMLAMFDEIPKYSTVAARRSQCWMCHNGSTRPERQPK